MVLLLSNHTSQKDAFGTLIDNALEMLCTNFDGPTSSVTKVVNITKWVMYQVPYFCNET